MKTLAQLKRDANTGKMKLELVERFGSTEIIERLQGVRKVLRSNTVGLTLKNKDGKESELRLDSAKLVEYTDDTLIVYQPGLRELNEQETKVLNEANAIVEEYEKKNPYGDGWYWKKKDYIEKSPCPYMSHQKVRGKLFTNGQIMDWSIKGKVALKYKVSWE